MEARELVAFGNTLSGVVMCVGTVTSEHSLEHAMSAYHQELPHGAGLIMISKAYFAHFIEKHVCGERFVRMAKAVSYTHLFHQREFGRGYVLSSLPYSLTPSQPARCTRTAQRLP